MDQTQQVRAERQADGHGCYQQRGSGQGGAHRHGGVPAAGLERNPHPRCRGYRRADSPGYALPNTAR
jgi:hypothetical protein